MAELTERALASVEALRASEGEPHLERQLSINEWTDRIRGFTREAFTHARAGNVQLERQAWAQVAQIAVARMEVIDWVEDNVDEVALVQSDDQLA